MKKNFLVFAFTLISQMGFSQEIKIKDDIVTVDGKECLKINDSDANNVSILDLEGNEIIFLKFIHNSRYARLYTKVTFLKEKLTFTSSSYIFTKKLLIKKLLADNTLENCKLNPEKVERFVLKYDESVEGH
ncbi:hypothetical protein NAT51_05410 [Flavobacterium amniphilum]|uniref:hypothetical protein n=1 Tax=Flavobacterium amniphilum TaxID=1834035 RepID=UPI00202AB304|nr:hypothetical protein [Flavobacterium amniphilum]MCL9804944.1 hypothetical protein [Flavobacterium amniphilum]